MATVAFDVDGTLIDNRDNLRHEVIDCWRSLAYFNNDIIVWSGGGVDYAKMWARRIGLRCIIVPKFEYPVDMAFDDMGDGLDPEKLKAKVIIKV